MSAKCAQNVFHKTLGAPRLQLASDDGCDGALLCFVSAVWDHVHSLMLFEAFNPSKCEQKRKLSHVQRVTSVVARQPRSIGFLPHKALV
jgi:hypothetical protein